MEPFCLSILNRSFALDTVKRSMCVRERGREKEINIYGGRHRQKNREIQTVWWFLTQTPYEGRKRYLYSLFLQNQNERCMLFKDAILTYIKRSLQCCHPVGDGQSEGRHSHLRHT